ncbi:DEAD-box ATP-dependent RNA helicase 50 [Impatiens glandulifera]|uniref:DEAD-box ATP-dependent RNA helicase 50 n=1 Tax=Impatiens glandulifera TaxID=253017 RepID=UPI001FB11CE1|nr:DEAD-box ATP-dependent RNA helicase 50 [Impatiens glandulifera]
MGEMLAACQFSSSLFVVPQQLRNHGSTSVSRVICRKFDGFLSKPSSMINVSRHKHSSISLFWSECFQDERPANSGGDGGRDRSVQVFSTDNPVASTEIAAKNFGRLKAQKVRILVEKFAKLKQEVNQRDSPTPEDISGSGSVHSSSFSNHEDGSKRVAHESQLKKIRTRKHQSRTKEVDINSTSAAAPNSKDPLKNKTVQTSTERDRGRTFPEGSANSKRWGAGESTSISKSKQRQQSSADDSFFSRKSFKELGCENDMIESLMTQRIDRPSCIQALAFASVIEGRSCIITDQSGSGKTLAYLVPIIQRLRQEEVNGLSKSFPQNPRVVILVPTAELARQVLVNCRLISKSGVQFRSMVATGGFGQRTQLEALQQTCDVLIATPGRFLFLVREGLLQLTNLKSVVLDEVDILLRDEEYETALKSLIESSSFATQYLFVTATLPSETYNKLVEMFPDCQMIMGPGMHRTNPALEEIIVDCSGDDGAEKTPETAFTNKKNALLQLLEENPVAKTIVFCNKIETCRKVENVLKRGDRKGVRMTVLPFHAALAQEVQLANIQEFCNDHQPQDSSAILVCTDRASRGIDFCGVSRVVLFDYPRDPSEYIRRVGRTARGVGGKGKAFVFVVGKQVSLAQRIIERNRKGHPLHDVPFTTYV